MPLCQLCGEQKLKERFYNIIHFTKFKKHRVTWCIECQQMYIEFKKEEQRKESLLTWNPTGIVTFD